MGENPEHRWKRRAAASVAALSLVALGVADGCGHPTGRAGGPPPAQPPWLARPLAASAPRPSAAPVQPLAASVVNPNQPLFDPSTVVALLDDPAHAGIRAQVERGATLGAADRLHKKLLVKGPKKDEAALWYQLGRLREAAGDPTHAVEAYDRAAALDWPLSDHARFHSGRLLVGMKQPGEALARLGAIKPGLGIATRVTLARASAHAAAHDVDAAGALWGAYLGTRPRPRGWQPVALKWARALLAQPSVKHAEKAVEVARMVIYESPGGRGVGEARDLEKKALATIPSKRRKKLDGGAERVMMERARDLSDARQGREAIAAADKLIKRLTASGADKPGEVACEAYMARGKGLATVRRYSESSDAYELAIARCKGLPRQVVALFVGARSALRGGKRALARRRYAELERLFPKHRFADDARLHGAETALSMGDAATFTRMLARIDEAYPKGDMVDQALFTLARARFEGGDWAGAVRPLQRAIKRQKGGRPYYAEGRPQYFLGRAKIELGDAAGGRALYRQVVRDFPMSYYALLAYNRLADHDRPGAREVLRKALASEPDGAFVIPDHAELHRPGFLRAVELVRQGDGAAALAELEALGVREATAHPSLLWASAFLLSRIDAPSASHGVLRGQPKLWMEHQPAGVWRPVWKVAYPRPFHRFVKKEIKRARIDEALAYGIMREESAFQPRVVSSANAYGLMQLILPTARMVSRKLGLKATRKTLKQPATNIALGCHFLGQLQRRFDYNPLLAIPGYNAGPGAPMKWIKKRPDDDFDIFVERIPYKETRRYTKRVMRSMAVYSVLYGAGLDHPSIHVPVKAKPR